MLFDRFLEVTKNFKDSNNKVILQQEKIAEFLNNLNLDCQFFIISLDNKNKFIIRVADNSAEKNGRNYVSLKFKMNIKEQRVTQPKIEDLCTNFENLQIFKEFNSAYNKMAKVSEVIVQTDFKILFDSLKDLILNEEESKQADLKEILVTSKTYNSEFWDYCKENKIENLEDALRLKQEKEKKLINYTKDKKDIEKNMLKKLKSLPLNAKIAEDIKIDLIKNPDSSVCTVCFYYDIYNKRADIFFNIEFSENNIEFKEFDLHFLYPDDAMSKDTTNEIDIFINLLEEDLKIIAQDFKIKEYFAKFEKINQVSYKEISILNDAIYLCRLLQIVQEL